MADYFMYNGCKVTEKVKFTTASNRSFSTFVASFTCEVSVRNDTSSTVTIPAGAFEIMEFHSEGVLATSFPKLFSVDVPASTTKIIYSAESSLAAERKATDYSKQQNTRIFVNNDTSISAESNASIIVPACPIIANVSGVPKAITALRCYLVKEDSVRVWWDLVPYINVNGVWREVT